MGSAPTGEQIPNSNFRKITLRKWEGDVRRMLLEVFAAVLLADDSQPAKHSMLFRERSVLRAEDKESEWMV